MEYESGQCVSSVTFAMSGGSAGPYHLWSFMVGWAAIIVDLRLVNVLRVSLTPTSLHQQEDAKRV